MSLLIYKQNETFTYQLLTDLIVSKVGKEYFSNKSTAIITQYLDKKINSINFKDAASFPIKLLYKIL